LNEGFHCIIVAAAEFYAYILSIFEISDDVFCGVDVAGGAFGTVLSNDVSDGGEVWSRLSGKPVETTI